MLCFTGDVNLTDGAFDVGFGVGSALKKGFNPFQFIEKKAGDVWIGNFEGVVSTTSKECGLHRKQFIVEPKYVGKELIDYWGVANNHVMEHGEEAYQEMVKHLSAVSKGIFGSKQQPSISFEHEGKKVAISAFSQRVDRFPFEPQYWYKPSCSDIQKELLQIQDADVKVAYIHWGVEFITYPTEDQKQFARWLIDAGYDLVIGMHPHILQGCEEYKGKHIFYSLGNFVFNMPWKPLHYGLVVLLDVRTMRVDYQYVRIDKRSAPHIVEEVIVPEYLRLPHLNGTLQKEKNIEDYVAAQNRCLRAYRKSNYRYMLRHVFDYKLSDVFVMLGGFFKRRLIK